jgi:dTDP-glucose 4,6-dehydratase
MNLLITGGAGFIGSRFIHQHLNGRGANGGVLVNLDKLTYAGNLENLAACADHAGYRFRRGDIADSGTVEALLEENAIDAVIHFAAESHVDRSIESPEPFFETNVTGTLRLLESARQYWRQLPPSRAARFRFLQVSTDEVYGSLDSEGAAFTEDSPILPNSPYAASKASGDHLLRSYYKTYGFPALLARCSNNYGPFQFPEKLIPLMILNALEGKPLPIYGDGGNVRDWIFVDDHCRALAEVLENGSPGEVYNIGGQCEKTNLEVAEALCESLDATRPRHDGSSYRELIRFVEDRPGHDRRYAIDCRKLEATLGWTPHWTFENGIRATVAWYLSNQSWCAGITGGVYQRERLGIISQQTPRDAG